MKISHVQEKLWFDPKSLIDVVKNYRHVRVIKMKVLCYCEFFVTLTFEATKAKVQDPFLPLSTLKCSQMVKITPLLL